MKKFFDDKKINTVKLDDLLKKYNGVYKKFFTIIIENESILSNFPTVSKANIAGILKICKLYMNEYVELSEMIENTISQKKLNANDLVRKELDIILSKHILGSGLITSDDKNILMKKLENYDDHQSDNCCIM